MADRHSPQKNTEKVVDLARLRFAGIRTSPGRVPDAGERVAGAAPGPQAAPDRMHDGTITSETVDVMWGTDMSQTVTSVEGVAHVFVAVDHCNSKLATAIYAF